eukprot:5227356-Pleurochrysis_carterae.AAC.1
MELRYSVHAVPVQCHDDLSLASARRQSNATAHGRMQSCSLFVGTTRAAAWHEKVKGRVLEIGRFNLSSITREAKEQLHKNDSTQVVSMDWLPLVLGRTWDFENRLASVKCYHWHTFCASFSIQNGFTRHTKAISAVTAVRALPHI